MPKVTTLDKQWQQLMALCESESRLRAEGGHARLLKLVAGEIERVGSEMGFSPQRIATRDFRAERDGGHIVRLISD
jgi:hypothetical protein